MVSYAVFKVARVCPIALINRPISELTHLARRVKCNLWLIPGLAVVVVCGTGFNRGRDFDPGLSNLTLGER